MFAGISCYKKSGHHDLYNFPLLCQNAAMSTLCRAKWKCPPAIAPAAKAGQRNGDPGRSRFYSLANHSPALIPSAPLEIGVESGHKGVGRISDNQKYFGNISEKQPFSENISDLFFGNGRGVSQGRPNWVKPMLLARLAGKS
jgi:hypothetical protein